MLDKEKEDLVIERDAIVDQLRRQKETISYLTNLIEDILKECDFDDDLKYFYKRGMRDAIRISSGECLEDVNEH